MNGIISSPGNLFFKQTIMIAFLLKNSVRLIKSKTCSSCMFDRKLWWDFDTFYQFFSPICEVRHLHLRNTFEDSESCSKDYSGRESFIRKTFCHYVFFSYYHLNFSGQTDVQTSLSDLQYLLNMSGWNTDGLKIRDIRGGQCHENFLLDEIQTFIICLMFIISR